MWTYCLRTPDVPPVCTLMLLWHGGGHPQSSFGLAVPFRTQIVHIQQELFETNFLFVEQYPQFQDDFGLAVLLSS